MSAVSLDLVTHISQNVQQTGLGGFLHQLNKQFGLSPVTDIIILQSGPVAAEPELGVTTAVQDFLTGPLSHQWH